MTAIVKGHGTDVDGQDTYVPDGVTVRMYTAAEVNLDNDIALLALLDEAGDPGVEITGTIRNYTLGTQDDEFIAQWYALGGQSSTPIWWVGTDIPDGTRLCSDPTACQAPAAHTCTGVLGLVHDTDIAIVACRGVAGQVGADVHTPTAYDQAGTEFKRRADWYLTKVETGEDAQVAEVETAVDALGQDEVAFLINTYDFQNWLRARWVKEYALLNDLEQLFGQLTSNSADLDAVMPWLTTVPSYGAALDTVATTYPETFTQWLGQANGQVRAALLARPAIAGTQQTV